MTPGVSWYRKTVRQAFHHGKYENNGTDNSGKTNL